MPATSKFILFVLSAFATNAALAENIFQAVKQSDVKWEMCDPKNSSDPCRIGYVRGNPEKEENYGFVKVPKGYTFPPHWHINNENFVIIQGVLVVGAENDSKGTPFRSGDYGFVPAKWIHWATCTDADCLFYLNNEGADSYIDAKDRRP
jgi:oxalate decarboxylase/phosphoglucose isomerase-like protein (cupin superfamily)